MSTGSPPAAPQRIEFYQASMPAQASVGYLMKQITAQVHRELQERMAAIGVTSAQWAPLALIGKGNGLTAADLARALSMNAGAMTRMLDRLSEKNLIRRERSELDRRATLLALTDEGRKAVGPIHQVLAATLNDLLCGFNRSEHDTLRALLQRMLVNAKALPQCRDAQACQQQPAGTDPA